MRRVLPRGLEVKLSVAPGAGRAQEWGFYELETVPAAPYFGPFHVHCRGHTDTPILYNRAPAPLLRPSQADTPAPRAPSWAARSSAPCAPAWARSPRTSASLARHRGPGAPPLGRGTAELKEPLPHALPPRRGPLLLRPLTPETLALQSSPGNIPSPIAGN